MTSLSYVCFTVGLTILAALVFFFNDTATTEIYTLSLHDALPISALGRIMIMALATCGLGQKTVGGARSEEHTSELQSRVDLVCRLLLEKKNDVRRCLHEPIHHRLTVVEGHHACLLAGPHHDNGYA